MMLWIAKFYSWIYGLCKDIFNFNLRGIGFIAAQIKKDAVLSVDNNKFYFDHTLSSCYVRMFSGKYNEPETHLFIHFLADHAAEELLLLDIGANIGEMVIDFSGHRAIHRVIAFEPTPECCTTITKSLQLNARSNVTVIQKAVSDTVGTMAFHMDRNSAVSSSLMGADSAQSVSVATTTIDEECPIVNTPSIMIVDVEGAELLVMKGAKKFIQNNSPVIIFEYNILGQQQYSLADIKNELGEGYEIYRLRQDGYLDDELTRTWNCVAAKKKTWAYELCMKRRR